MEQNLTQLAIIILRDDSTGLADTMIYIVCENDLNKD